MEFHSLTFKGQAKRRANFNPDEVLEVPTMVNTFLVLAGLNRLAEIGRKYDYDVNDHVNCMAICDKKTSKEISRDSKDSFSPKELRAIYGELTYKVFANESTSQNIWFQQVLGHGENQTETANSYIKYYIPETEVENLKSMVFS
nr:protelomerase family protein [Nostoc sp. NMS4]